MMEKKRISRKWYWIGGVLIVLIAARLSMEYFVTRHVNRVLSGIEGYRGSIYDVDLHLYRGAYVIDSLKIFKVDGNKEVPFIDIPKTDLSLEWNAIFDGALVGEVTFESPRLNFIGGNKNGTDEEAAGNQTGKDADWTKPIRELMPLKINRMEINNGTVTYHDFTTSPEVDVSLKQFHAIATNLNNATGQEERLPSTISATATSIGGGKLTLNMGINIMKAIPDLDLDLKFEQVDMPALNDFFRAYAKVDVERGAFNLYSEMTIDSGMVAGYVKPIALNVKFVDWQKDKQQPLNLLWQSVVGMVAEVFENQKEDQLATKVPLNGDLNQLEAGVWPSVWNIFSNAFVQAFERNTDNTVQFSDQIAASPAAENGSEKGKSKSEARADRREQRKQKRELRKEKKKQNKQS